MTRPVVLYVGSWRGFKRWLASEANLADKNIHIAEALDVAGHGSADKVILGDNADQAAYAEAIRRLT